MSKKMESSQLESQSVEINAIKPVEVDSHKPVAKVVEPPVTEQVGPKSPLIRSKTDFAIISFVARKPEKSPQMVSLR